MTALTERERRLVRAVFAPCDFDAVEHALIERCGHNLPFLETASPGQLERYRFAAIRCSAGTMAGLREALDLAAADWRNLLVAAGFAEDPMAHTSWWPH